MKYYERVVSGAERKTGLSAAEIRTFSPERIRLFLEKKNGKKFRFVSEFPTIGRGNVLRDNIASRDDLDREIDDMLL